MTDLEVATTEEELLALKGSGKDGSVSLDVLGEETNVALDVSNEQGPKDEQVEEGDDDEGRNPLSNSFQYSIILDGKPNQSEENRDALIVK